jgi:signal transduction histidine kinase
MKYKTFNFFVILGVGTFCYLAALTYRYFTLSRLSGFVLSDFILMSVFNLTILVALASMLFYYIGVMISYPLVKMTREIEEIKKGNLNFELSPSRIKEIQALRDALSRFMISIKLILMRNGKEINKERKHDETGNIKHRVSIRILVHIISLFVLYTLGPLSSYIRYFFIRNTAGFDASSYMADTIFMMIGATLMFILVLHFSSKAISDPIEMAIKNIESASKGNFNSSFTKTNIDEINNLNKSVESLLDIIKRKMLKKEADR